MSLLNNSLKYILTLVFSAWSSSSLPEAWWQALPKDREGFAISASGNKQEELP